MTRRLSGVGEDALLERIRRRFSRQRGAGLVLGPGDDAALARLKPGRLLVATHDDLAEGAHFERRWTDFRRLAHKLLRVNLSDLAAMGAVEPLGVLVGAAFPPESPAAWAQDFLRGLSEDARRFGVPVLGGNLAGGERLFFGLTALGQARPGQILRRSGARAGDVVAGVGPVGDAAQELAALKAGRRTAGRAFWEPEPQFAAARVLAERRLATSLIDNSDGLARSCALLARASGLGLRLDELPALRRPSGEDYGLVFTVPPGRWAELRRRLPAAYRLGELRPRGEGVPASAGFEHF